MSPQETSSFDTVGNAYFSLTMHVIPAAWRNIAVVTSHFHMARSRELFADMYRTAGLSLFNDANRCEGVGAKAPTAAVDWVFGS